MKCPKCKKPTSLQTKRTLAHGSRVTRDRQCPRCKTRFVTVEQFQTDIEAAKVEVSSLLTSLDADKANLGVELEGLKQIFRAFGRAVKEASK